MLRRSLVAVLGVGIAVTAGVAILTRPVADFSARDLNQISERHESGFTTVADRYDVVLKGERFEVVSNARLLDADAAVQAFRSQYEDDVARVSEILGLEPLSQENAQLYTERVVPLMTATEFDGLTISEQDRAAAKKVLDMAFLISGEQWSAELKDVLTNLQTLDPDSPEFTAALAQVSQFLPAPAADNGRFMTAVEEAVYAK